MAGVCSDAFRVAAVVGCQVAAVGEFDPLSVGQDAGEVAEGGLEVDRALLSPRGSRSAGVLAVLWRVFRFQGRVARCSASPARVRAGEIPRSASAAWGLVVVNPQPSR